MRASKLLYPATRGMLSKEIGRHCIPMRPGVMKNMKGVVVNQETHHKYPRRETNPHLPISIVFKTIALPIELIPQLVA